MTTIIVYRTLGGSYSVKVKALDPDIFRAAITTLKTFVPVANRAYNPTEKLWTVDEYGADCLHRWVDYCRVNLKAEIQWRDPDASGQSEKTWTPPPPPRHPTSAEAFKVLHLLPSAPPEVVKAAYRALAQKHHPDHSGDTATMQKINTAFDLLSKQVAA